ncbi:hypothetical protein ACFXPS_29125 [Nocardia sp. NPDC059091]|uniref:hypothetical protein n=1 Tax=Nocardia sp. NPDC059091 TaxID=3346724 RepID=UPI0036808D8A
MFRPSVTSALLWRHRAVYSSGFQMSRNCTTARDAVVRNNIRDRKEVIVKRAAVLAALLATGSLALGGCSNSHGSASTPSGSMQSATGGETTCEDFLAADKTRKESIIETYLRSTGQSASRSSITATRLSAEAFCRTTGKNKLVRDITTG